MITTKDLLDSLKLQDVCPKCGANWREIVNLLHEPAIVFVESHINTIINNCPVCQMRFGEVN